MKKYLMILAALLCIAACGPEEVPTVPEGPDTPEVPVDPEKPDDPENPDDSEKPDVPEQPVEPAEPEVTEGPLAIGQVDNLTKILPGGELMGRFDTLRVARGETATLQLAMTAMENVGAVRPSLKSYSGDASSMSMGWLRYVKCSSCWHAWAHGAPADELFADGDMYPDPIMPVEEWDVSLSAGEKAVLWTEFKIARDYPAGIYEGEISVDAADTTYNVPFAVQVYDAVLPEKQSLTLVQWETGTYDAMNNGAAVEVGSDRYFELQAGVVRQVSEYGQNGFRLNDGIVPSKVSSWYNYDSNGELLLDPETGKPEFFFDFWSIEKYIQNYIDNCPDIHHIHAPGFVSLDAKGRLKGAIRYYAGNGWPDGKGAYPEDQDAIEFCKAYFSKLEKHLKSKQLPDGRTWFDIFYQSIFDEPIDARASDWNKWAELIKAGSPEMKIVEATSTNKLNPDLCDVLCPLLDKLQTTVAKDGQTQWFYTGMSPQGPYANRLVRMPLIKTRLLHWLNYKYDASGFLHWGLMYWMGVEDPYKEIQGSGFPGGDLFIIYPGDGKAYPSIRLSSMRDGIHDYELLRLIAARSEADADAFADRIVLGYSSYETDVDAFRQVRREMLEYLSR